VTDVPWEAAARGGSVDRGGVYDNLTRVLLVTLGAIAAIFILYRFALSATYLPLDYNEGWNAYHVQRLLQTGSPYPTAAQAGLVINNYPPLWFPVVALAGRFTSSLLFAGRLVASLGFLSMLTAVTVAGGILRGRRGALAALVVTAFLFATQATRYVGIADPQLFAQGVATWALVLCARARSTSDRFYLAAVAVAVFSGFIKHNLASLPLALLIAAALDGVKPFSRVVLIGGITLVVGYVLSAMIGGAAWPLNLDSPRTYFYGRLVNQSIPILLSNAAGLGLAFIGTGSLPDGHVKRVLRGYLIIALPLAMLFVGGFGVGTNIFYDTMLVMAFSASLAISAPGRLVLQPDAGPTSGGVARELPRWLGSVAVSLWLVAAAQYSIRDLVHGRLTRYPVAAKMFREDVAFLRGIKGDAICLELTDCYEAGKRMLYDPFNANQSLITGRISAERAREIIGSNVQAIQFGDTTTVIGSLPAPIRADIDSNFVIARHNENGTILVRRSNPVLR
jgi:hypothetical protein